MSYVPHSAQITFYDKEPELDVWSKVIYQTKSEIYLVSMVCDPHEWNSFLEELK